MSLFPVFAPAATPVSVLNFVGFTASGSSGSTLEDFTANTYSSVSIGSNTGASRVVLVAAVTIGGGGGTDGMSGITCGGDSGTQVFEFIGNNHATISIYRFTGGAITSGTTKDIVTTYQRTTKRGGIYVYEGTDLVFKSGLSATATSSGTTISKSFDIEAGQVVMGFEIHANGENRDTLTFSSNLTERTDVGLGPDAGSPTGSGTQTGCADGSFDADASSEAFTVAYSGTTQHNAASFVVFGPS